MEPSSESNLLTISGKCQSKLVNSFDLSSLDNPRETEHSCEKSNQIFALHETLVGQCFYRILCNFRDLVLKNEVFASPTYIDVVEMLVITVR